MLYKFKSRSTADVIMLEANGRQLLKIIGKGDEPHGIITVAQIPAAIEALQAAAAAEEAAAREQDQAGGEGPDDAAQDGDGQPREAVSLRQRAVPFIDMLRRSAAEDHDVIW